MRLQERSAIIPGRVMTRSKAIFGEWATSGHGAEISIYGHGDRPYIDMLCSLGAVTLGHGYHSQGDGVLSLPHVNEIEAAEAVLAHVAPWASSVRFTVTGSEACHAAYRIAKKATGRSRVLIGDWAYHGWHEWCTEAETFWHGRDFADDGYDWQRWEGLAAVFIEPHRWEVLPEGKTWLQEVRAFCDRIGALLVFDSMIWGGRHSFGGLSEWSGVIPDIECFGKSFGNGEPVAFVVGNEALAQHGTVVSGTYSGHPRAMQAAIDTIHTYTTEPVIATLWQRGRQLQEGLRRIVPAHIGVCEGMPVHQRIRFFEESHGPKFTAEMLKRGVIWHHACANVAYAHTPEMIDRVIAAAAESLEAL